MEQAEWRARAETCAKAESAKKSRASVETTEAFVFLNASVDGLGRGWYALETVAGRNNQSVFHAVSPLLALRGRTS